MRDARRFALLFLLFIMSECMMTNVYSQSDSLKPTSGDSLAVENNFENQMLDWTNQYRFQNGLKDLVQDEALTELARNHSREMALQGFISHDLPTGTVSTRMVRAGYYHDSARENVARSRTISWAHDALLKSPLHEENIVAVDVTRIGIGIVRAPSPNCNMLYITEIFATPRQMPPVQVIHEGLRSRINELRQSGAGTLTSDPRLEQLASTSLNSLAYPYEKEELRTLLANSTQKLQENGCTELSRVAVNVQLVRDPLNIKIPAQNTDKDAAVYGSAVRKVFDNTHQPAFLVMTLVGFKSPSTVTRIASR
jgi:uncharacterized protein YkwD